MQIQKLIDDSLLKEQESRKDRVRSGKISPSALGWCYRRQYFNLNNTPQTNPPDSRALRIFKVGHLFHEFIQGYMPENECEVLAENEDIKGYADIVTKDTVYDIKSQHSRGFWYMNKDGYDVKKEKYNNWLQLACYGIILKKEKLGLVIVSKDDMCMNEYIEQTNDWADKLAKEIYTINENKDKMPPAEARMYKGKECTYCNWKDKCKEIEKE